MYVRVCVCVCVCVCVHACVHACVSVCVSVCVCAHVNAMSAQYKSMIYRTWLKQCSEKNTPDVMGSLRPNFTCVLVLKWRFAIWVWG